MNITIPDGVNVMIPDGVDVTIVFPLALIGIIMGLGIMLINIWLKSPLLWLCAAICFIGVWFEPALSDTYYQAGAIVLIVACFIMATFNYRQRRSGNMG
jgi:membrane protein YdbS with pleckstrin-like domain